MGNHIPLEDTSEECIRQAMRRLRISSHQRGSLQRWLDGSEPFAQAVRIVTEEARRQQLMQGTTKSGRPTREQHIEWLRSRLDADTRPRAALIGADRNGTIVCAEDVIVGSLEGYAGKYVRRIAETALECGASNVTIGLRGSKLGGANALAETLGLVGLHLNAVVHATFGATHDAPPTVKEPTIAQSIRHNVPGTTPRRWHPRRQGGPAGETQGERSRCETLGIDPQAPWAQMMSHRGPARSITEERVHAARDLTRAWLATKACTAADKAQVLETEQAKQALREYLASATKGEHHERVIIVYLDHKMRVITVEEASRGTIAGSSLDTSVVLHTALELGASNLIMAHWHPSGDASPSDSDRAITEKMTREARRFDIDVVDHIVMGDTEAFSLLECR